MTLCPDPIRRFCAPVKKAKQKVELNLLTLVSPKEAESSSKPEKENQGKNSRFKDHGVCFLINC